MKRARTLPSTWPAGLEKVSDSKAASKRKRDQQPSHPGPASLGFRSPYRARWAAGLLRTSSVAAAVGAAALGLSLAGFSAASVSPPPALQVRSAKEGSRASEGGREVGFPRPLGA